MSLHRSIAVNKEKETNTESFEILSRKNNCNHQSIGNNKFIFIQFDDRYDLLNTYFFFSINKKTINISRGISFLINYK
jgi:hypothetical protein